MWTDSKGGFTWCVYSSWVSFSTSISCLKCESWSPIPYKAPFSWDLNRTLGFIFSVKFMFCLFPCFHPKPRDIWLLKKCLSRRGAGFKRLVCAKGGLPFPVTPPACWSKPHSFLHFKKVVWWWQDNIQSLLFCEHKIFRNIVPSCWRLTLSGEMRRTEMRGWSEVSCLQMSHGPSAGALHVLFCFSSPPFPSLLSAPRPTYMDCTGALWKLLAPFGLSQWGGPAGDWRGRREGDRGFNSSVLIQIGCLGLGVPLDISWFLLVLDDFTARFWYPLLPLSLWAQGWWQLCSCQSQVPALSLWFPFIHLWLCDPFLYKRSLFELSQFEISGLLGPWLI